MPRSVVNNDLLYKYFNIIIFVMLHSYIYKIIWSSFFLHFFLYFSARGLFYSVAFLCVFVLKEAYKVQLTIEDLVSKETVCCISGKVKHLSKLSTTGLVR